MASALGQGTRFAERATIGIGPKLGRSEEPHTRDAGGAGIWVLEIALLYQGLLFCRFPTSLLPQTDCHVG